MKNHKGEIATLLTLGLVLVGGLVTLATSFIVNRQNNLGSNPRAGLSCPSGSTCYTTIDSCSQINKTSANAECIVGVREGICCKTSSSTGPTSTPKPSPTPTGKAGSGNQWPRDPAQGYDATGKLCPNTGLEFACCVEYYNQCADGKSSYTWYGCTGQPCGNTKISQSNGPGKLVACIPNGVGKNANKSCAAVAPTVAPNNCITRNSQYQYRDYEYACRNEGVGCTTGFTRAYDSGKPLSCGNDNLVCCRKPRANETPVPPLVGINTGGGTIPASGNASEELAQSNKQDEEEIINSPTPRPTVDPSGQCITNQECEDNKGIFYSYKCLSPQLNGCGRYEYYKSKTSCSGNEINQNDFDDYCANTGSFSTTRSVTVKYNIKINQTIDYLSGHSIATLSVYKRGSFGRQIEIYFTDTLDLKTENSLEGSKSIKTSDNELSWSLTYIPRQIQRGLRYFENNQTNPGPNTLTGGKQNIVNGQSFIEATF